MKYLVIISIFVLLFCSASALSMLDLNSADFHQCLSKLNNVLNSSNANSVLIGHLGSSLISANSLDDIFNLLHINAQQEVLVFNSDLKFSYQRAAIPPIDYVLLLVTEINILRDFFVRWPEMQYYNVQAKFLILLEHNENKFKQMNQIAQMAWFSYTYKILLLDLQDLKLYRPGTLTKPDCRITEMLNFQQCTGTNSSFDFINSIDFKGCEVKVLGVPFEPFVLDIHALFKGLEPQILEIIADQLGFHVRYIDHEHASWGRFYPNGSVDGLFYELQQGRGDLMIGSVNTLPFLPDHFDQSAHHLFTEVYFCVPRARQISAWLYIARVFTPQTWLAYAIGFLSIIAIDFLFAAIQQHNNATLWETFWQSCMDILAIALTQSIANPPGRLVRRTLLLAWVWFAFTFASCYQTVFLSYLVQPVYEPQIASWRDVAASPLRVHGIWYAKAMITPYEDVSIQRLLQRYDIVSVEEVSRDMQRIIDDRNITVLAATHRTLYAIQSRKVFLDEDKRIAFHFVAPPVITYYMSICMRRGFPLREGIDRKIVNMLEGGLIGFFERNLSYVEPKRVDGGSFMPIGIDKVGLAFAMYCVGVLMASLAFTCECLTSYYYHEGILSGMEEYDFDHEEEREEVDEEVIEIE